MRSYIAEESSEVWMIVVEVGGVRSLKAKMTLRANPEKLVD